MATLHETSTCCGARVYRFGGKRRCCAQCRRTWSIHRGRCGRKRVRAQVELPRQLILEHVSAGRIGRRQHRSVSTIYRRCRESINRLVSRPEVSDLPAGADLVLIVDGLRFTTRGVSWVQYNVALKPVTVDVAYFADPVFRLGGESSRNWEHVLTGIQPAIRARIRALVADGLRGMNELAVQNGWVYQRCHFHIRALLRYWLSGPWVSPANAAIRWAIDDALLSTDEEQAEVARTAMIAHVRRLPGGMSGTLGQMVHDWDAIRAYLRYPHLSIPNTTNVVESMHNRLRQVVSGVSTIDAILRRATAFIRLHGPFTCNGQHFQQH
jgi:hypothetical protein